MHLVDQRILGISILLLLAFLVAVKRSTTGSIVEKPDPQPLLWLVNAFNLFFLLIVNPLTAILLIARQLQSTDPTSMEISSGWLLTAVEITGGVVYLAGFVLMAWALMRLGRNYQLGGSDPRAGDAMIADGPYALVRHPMYTAALCIALGLACLTQSLFCMGVFVIYLVLIILLIPFEEERLRRAYGERYAAYQQRVKKFVPLFF